jgi:hypothetical protein
VTTQRPLERFPLLWIEEIRNVTFRSRRGEGWSGFVLREQLSYGDNFMMFWEMIFRVILAYLRKLAVAPPARLLQ